MKNFLLEFRMVLVVVAGIGLDLCSIRFGKCRNYHYSHYHHSNFIDDFYRIMIGFGCNGPNTYSSTSPQSY